MESTKGGNVSDGAALQGQRQGGVAGSPNYSPTAEEIRVLQECRQESFYYRCIPLSVLTIGGMKILEIRGMMKPGLFKYMSGGLMAYLVGKWSYQKQCQQKLMSLTNSELGDALRSGKSITQFLYEKKVQVPVRNVPVPEENTSEIGLYNAPDIDSATNIQHKGLDDNFRASIDDTGKAKQSDSSAGGNQKGVSYEELRAENRSQFQRRQNERMQPLQAPPTVTPTLTPTPYQPGSLPEDGSRPSSDSFSPPTVADERPARPAPTYGGEEKPRGSSSRRKNKYGDLIEE